MNRGQYAQLHRQQGFNQNRARKVTHKMTLTLTRKAEQFSMGEQELSDEIISWLSDLGYDVLITNMETTNTK